jgi:hypothetical protein
VAYREIVACLGRRIEDAADATRLAERVRKAAGLELLAAPRR